MEETINNEPEVKEPEAPKMRQIIIETDGDSIHIKKREVAGNIELIGILRSILDYLTNTK